VIKILEGWALGKERMNLIVGSFFYRFMGLKLFLHYAVLFTTLWILDAATCDIIDSPCVVSKEAVVCK